MKWLVDGADSTSGNEQTIIVDAETMEQARREATRRGMFVSSIREMELAEPAEPPDPLQALASAKSGQSGTPDAVDYRTPRPREIQQSPYYRGLLIGGTLACWVAYVYYVLGVILLLSTIVGVLNSQPLGSGRALVTAAIAMVFPLTVFAGGVLIHTIGSGALALRDIARNSFR